MSGEVVPVALVPLACTLPSEEQPLRVEEFDALFRGALQAVDRTAPTRLVLTLAPAPGRAEAVRELTGREAQCCSFFTFSLAEEPSLRLDVTVRAAYVRILDGVEQRTRLVSGLGP